jgi:predicted nuclease of predicted toxin-antitoxin system
MLSESGYAAEHVADIGLLSASDSEIWQYAIAHDAVLITKDEDFADQVVLGRPAPIVVWVRLGNTSRRALLEWFAPTIGRVVDMAETGERLIELR